MGPPPFFLGEGVMFKLIESLKLWLNPPPAPTLLPGHLLRPWTETERRLIFLHLLKATRL